MRTRQNIPLHHCPYSEVCLLYTMAQYRLRSDYIYKHFYHFQFQVRAQQRGAPIKIDTFTSLYA